MRCRLRARPEMPALFVRFFEEPKLARTFPEKYALVSQARTKVAATAEILALDLRLKTNIFCIGGVKEEMG